MSSFVDYLLNSPAPKAEEKKKEKKEQPVASADKKQKTLGERFLYSLNKFFVHDGPVGVLGRGLGTYDPTLHDLSVPYSENVRRNKAEVQEAFKEREKAFQKTAEEDPIIREGDRWYSPGSLARGAADFGGVMAGSLLTDPTTYIAPGRTAGARIASQAGISGGVDAALQGADVGFGVRDEIDPLQVGINTAAGGALQGLGEGGAALARALRNRGTKSADEVIEEFVTGYDPEEGVLRVQVTDDTPAGPWITHGDIRNLGNSGIQERPAAYEMPNGDTFFVVERKAPGEDDFVPREVIGGRDFDGNPIEEPDDFLPEIEVDDIPSYGTPNELVNYQDPSITQQITELTEDEAMDLIAQRTGVDPRTLPQENPVVPEELPFDPDQAAAQRARLNRIGQPEEEPVRTLSELDSEERARLFADIEKTQEPLIYDEAIGDFRDETAAEKIARHAQIDEQLETSLRLDSPRRASQRQEGRLGSIGPGQGIVPEELPEGILEPTRTPRSRETTRELGREQFPDEEAFLERGTVPDISPAAARGAELADESLRDVVDLAANGQIDSPEFQAALDRANPLVDAHSKNSQTAGRTLNILGQDVSAKEAKAFLELAQDPDRAKEFARLAERYKDDPEAIRMIVRYSTEPTFLDKLYGLRMGFMLSGLKTQLYNTLGTSSHILVDLATKGVAAGVDVARLGASDRLTFREMASRLAGLRAGAKAAAETVGIAYRDGRPLDELSRADATRYKPTGKFNIPLKAMAAQDEFFRQVAKYSNTYGLATREGLRMNLTGDELESTVKQLIELALLPKKTLGKMLEASKKEGAPTSLIESALRIARQSDEYAKDMRFMGEPSQLATKLSEARTHKEGESPWDKGWKVLLNLTFPFIRTPDNLIRTAINYTPGANLLTKRFKDDFAAGGARRSEAIARVGISTGLASGIFNLWQDGLITGVEPSDWRERQAWQEAGNKPLAIKDAEGNVLGTLSGAEPWVYPVALLTTLFDEFQDIENVEAEDYPEKIAVAIVAMADQIKDLGYLSGLNDLIQAGEEAKEGKSNALANWLANVGSSFGTPAIVRQATQSFSDPVSRDTGADSLGDRVLNRIISGYPSEIMNPLGLPGSKDLPARVDRQGREVGREFAGPDLFSRSERPLEEQTPLSRELARLEFGPGGEIQPLIQPVEGEINSKEYPIGKLTKQQRRNYQVVTSAYFDAVMQEKMATPEWSAMRDDERKDFIKKAYSQSKKWAKEDLFSDYVPEEEEEFIWGRATSGRRTRAGNRAVGGVENSTHLTGEGIDLVPNEGVSWRQLEEKAVEWFGAENVINEGDHIHVDIPGGNVPYYGARGTQ